MKIRQFIRSYVEEPRVPIRPQVHFSNEEYGRVQDEMIIGAVDCVSIHDRAMILLKRNVYPMKGWWWFGGRQRFGELEQDAISRIMLKETGLKIDAQRFELVSATTYLWNRRAQEPAENGSQMRSWTFAVELSPAEVADMDVDLNEYAPGSIRWFKSRSELEHEYVHQVILDVWDALFA